MVPKRRDLGAVHEVAVFASVQESIASYIKNLNTGMVYEQLREVRYQLRLKGEEPSGYELAKGLEKYSARGQHYIGELQSMIRVNQALIQLATDQSTINEPI